MNIESCTSLLSAVVAGFSSSAMADPANDVAPTAAQEPIFKHLQLSNTQVTEIKTQHQQLADIMDKISIECF